MLENELMHTNVLAHVSVILSSTDKKTSPYLEFCMKKEDDVTFYFMTCSPLTRTRKEMNCFSMQ